MTGDHQTEDAAAAELKPLRVPPVQSVQFARNFIQTVVSELRFPALVEIEKPTIDRFRRTVRDILPLYDVPHSITVAIPSGAAEPPEASHRFGTKHGDTALTLTHHQLVLETRKYVRFESFIELLEQVVERASALIDSSFFTRIGLRYVNTIPVPRHDLRALEGWINPDLVRPLSSGLYGSVSHFVQEIRGPVAEGQYTFRHGLGKPGARMQEGYVLDFDYYAETVETDDVLRKLRSFHETNFSFFMWAIGPKAKEHLGTPTPKPSNQ